LWKVSTVLKLESNFDKMTNQKMTLGEFIFDNQSAFPYSTGELSKLINAIRLTAKITNHEVNKAG